MKTLIISEAGINSNGNLAVAHQQIDLSKDSGADVVKFQFYNPDDVLGKNHPYNAYAWDCQFLKSELEDLKRHCDDVGIEFLVSVFDLKDLDWALKLCKRVKVASRMKNNEGFVKAAIASGKPVLISTNTPYNTLNPKLTYLYCITNYPTKIAEYNKEILATCEGFSTHCPKIGPALYAVMNSCKVVEAHTTLDRAMPGCDQSSSWLYSELKEFAKLVREFEILK